MSIPPVSISYEPQHPLPKEILEMEDNDETSCDQCGVSYLIHREVKMLKASPPSTLPALCIPPRLLASCELLASAQALLATRRARTTLRPAAAPSRKARTREMRGAAGCAGWLP